MNQTVEKVQPVEQAAQMRAVNYHSQVPTADAAFEFYTEVNVRTGMQRYRHVAPKRMIEILFDISARAKSIYTVQGANRLIEELLPKDIVH